MHKTIVFLSLLVLTSCTTSAQVDTQVDTRAVGFNLERLDTLDRDDFNDMRQYYGACLVRLSFAATPLYDYDESNFRWRRNQANFQLLEQKLLETQRAGLIVIVDPHRVFGSSNIFTLTHKSKFWQNPQHSKAWSDAVADLADFLEKRPYHDHIWGIDLINEPGAFAWRQKQGMKEGNPDRYLKTDINVVYQEMIRKIRQQNKSHRLIIMFFEEDFKDGTVKSPDYYLSQLPIEDRTAAKSKLYFSSHIYWPNIFTFQGLQGRKAGIVWPDQPAYATEKNLDKRMGWITSWQSKHGVNDDHIFIGEWGLTQGSNLAWNGNTQNPSNGGRQWMDQVHRHIRKYHWTVHQYGGNPMLNINIPTARRQYISDLIRDSSPRSDCVANNYGF